LFHQLARVHGWELDLAPGWQIATQAEADALVLDAIGRVLRETDQAVLLTLLAALGDGAPPRSIHRALESLVEEGHRAFRGSGTRAWQAVGHPPPLPAAEVAAAKAFLLDPPAGLRAELEAHTHWPSMLVKLRNALERDDWKALVALTPV